MTYPTPEEINQIAKECGIDPSEVLPSVVYEVNKHTLQSFFLRGIEMGMKMQTYKDSELLESLLRIRDAIKQNDGVINVVTLDDIWEEATAAIVSCAESNAIRNNTGE